MFVIKRLLFVILAMYISSCDNLNLSRGRYSKPYGVMFGMLPYEKSDPVYNKAWTDGCESAGNTQFATTFYNSFYEYKRDSRFVGIKSNTDADLVNGKPITEDQKNVYNWVWYQAYRTCRHQILGTLKIAGMTPDIPGQVIGVMHNPLANGRYGFFGFDKLSNNGANIPFANW